MRVKGDSFGAEVQGYVLPREPYTNTSEFKLHLADRRIVPFNRLTQTAEVLVVPQQQAARVQQQVADDAANVNMPVTRDTENDMGEVVASMESMSLRHGPGKDVGR